MANITERDFSYQNASRMTDTSSSIPKEQFIGYCDGNSDFDILMSSISTFAGYPILALGTVSHMLVIVFVLVNKRLRSLPLSPFLVTMSVSGFFALYMTLLPIILVYSTCHTERYKDQLTDTEQLLFNAAYWFFSQLYSWMEASIAVQRMCAVRWPLTYHTRLTRQNNANAITTIVISLLTIQAVIFTLESVSTATLDDEELSLALYYVDIVVYVVLPLIIVLPANITTLKTVSNSLRGDTRRIARAKPIAITMLILNVTFVLTTLPRLIIIFNDQLSSHYEVRRVSFVVCGLMLSLCNSLTFPVYVAVTAKFREVLSELFNLKNKDTSSAPAKKSRISKISGGRLEAQHVKECKNSAAATGVCVASSEAPTTNGKV